MTDSDNSSENDEDIPEKVPRLMRSVVGPAAGVDNDVCFFVTNLVRLASGHDI